MGDMAEYYLQQGLDNLADDYEEWGYGGEGSYGPCLKTCRYCKLTRLHWEIFGGGYRLHDASGKIHVCAPPKAKEVFKK